ncbi:MAG: DinB family protein [Bryobacteraceae bacterium]
MTERLFAEFSIRKLRQLEGRIADCLGRLTDEQIWARGSENENAVGNLVLHLSGNVRQWMVSGVGGRPDTRMRDREFAARDGMGRTDLLERLRGTLELAVPVIEGLSTERLQQSIHVQNYDVTVLEAIYHVVEHFAMHTGQIVFATKLMTQEDLGFYRHLSGKPAPVDPVP